MSKEGRAQLYYICEPPYRAILSALDSADQSLPLTDLADRVVKQGETVMNEDQYEDRLKRQLISLHHNALPRLTEDGLIAYDPDTNIVSLRTDTLTEILWTEADSFEDVFSHQHDDGPADRSSIGTIEGREAVIEYGRALADEAVEELFCMYVTTDLLEDECLSHAKDAIDRGVEMYLGSRNAEVRDLTRRHLPEATLWEPRRGWLNAPTEYPKIGRLVLVDRQKVMLAVLGSPEDDGRYPDETAVVGEGEDNPLVVLVRELLGPRLDHLDHQSEDFQTYLHS